MLNNCKDKGRNGLHFSQQKGKNRKNSHVGIFIKQHMGIACAFRKPCCINILVHFFAKNSST